MPSGTEPGAVALLATVGSNDDGNLVKVSRVTGGFEFRVRHIQAPTPSATAPNVISNS
jgi:hypothetical protein